jgi:hypothetical protein
MRAANTVVNLHGEFGRSMHGEHQRHKQCLQREEVSACGGVAVRAARRRLFLIGTSLIIGTPFFIVFGWHEYVRLYAVRGLALATSATKPISAP